MSLMFELSENTSKRVQVAKTGTFNHEIYGKFSITPKDLIRMKENFDADARRQKTDGRPVLPFDYRHDDHDIAAGWIVGLELSSDELYAEVEWTPEGARKIKDKEFKFVSPDILRNYKDAETGAKFDVVLKGAALTNIPFLRDMKAVQLLSESKRKAFESLKLSGDADFNLNTGANMHKLVEDFKSMSPGDQEKFLAECGLTKKDVKLSEELDKTKTELGKARKGLKLAETERDELKTKYANSDDLSEKLKLAESKHSDLKKEVLKLTQERAADKKESQFNALLPEGKACPAQKDAFMKGDVVEFAKLSEEVKLDEAGKNAKGDEGGEIHEKVHKLAEEKMKADDGLSLGDAYSLVLSENPALNKKYEEVA